MEGKLEDLQEVFDHFETVSVANRFRLLYMFKERD